MMSCTLSPRNHPEDFQHLHNKINDSVSSVPKKVPHGMFALRCDLLLLLLLENMSHEQQQRIATDNELTMRELAP